MTTTKQFDIQKKYPELLIDAEDLPEVNKFFWTNGKDGYLINVENDEPLSRFLMKPKRDEYVIRLNGNFDYRKQSLKVSKNFVKSLTKRKPIKPNSSHETLQGAYFAKGSWYSTITYNRVKYYLGTYKTPEQASFAYHTAIQLLMSYQEIRLLDIQPVPIDSLTGHQKEAVKVTVQRCIEKKLNNINPKSKSAHRAQIK